MTTREHYLKLIWRHTHRDYRGKIDGEKAILVLREGGTHAVKLTDLTEAEFRDKAAYALKKEDARKRPD